MRPSGRLIALLVLVAAAVLAVFLRGASTGSSPEHRTDSDAANGASALPQLASALGRSTNTLADSFAPPPGGGVLFVFTPTQPYTDQDVGRLWIWLRAGGTLVYAAESGDSALDLKLGVRRSQVPVSGQGRGVGPFLTGVDRVAGGEAVAALSAPPSAVAVLRNGDGDVLAYEQSVGAGRVFVLSDPLPLCNGYLGQASNGRLATDLISLAPPGGTVGFDEFHHGVGAQSPLTGPLSTAWGLGIAWAVVAAFVALFLRGRAFGPRLELPGAGERPSTEHVAAVGRLLQRSGAVVETGELLSAATRRSLARRHGRQLPQDIASELAAAESELRRDRSGRGLAAAAARLHRLAYPLEHPTTSGDLAATPLEARQ